MKYSHSERCDRSTVFGDVYTEVGIYYVAVWVKRGIVFICSDMYLFLTSF